MKLILNFLLLQESNKLQLKTKLIKLTTWIKRVNFNLVGSWILDETQKQLAILAKDDITKTQPDIVLNTILEIREVATKKAVAKTSKPPKNQD